MTPSYLEDWLTLLHSVRPKLYSVLVFLSAVGFISFLLTGTRDDSIEEEVQVTRLPTSVIEGSTLQAFVAKAAAD